MASVAGQPIRRTIQPWLVPALGYSLSIACLVWVYWGFDWKTELPKFAAADWRWVTVSVIADLAVYFCQGWRWTLLLRPVARVRFLRSVQAVYIGLFANEVLPFRSGEAIRCYMLSRWGHVPFSVSLSSAVVERMFDGTWLVLGFLVLTAFVALPGYLVQASNVLAVVLVFVAVLLGIVMFRKHHAHAAVKQSRWSEMLWHVVEGLHSMGNSPWFIAAAAASLLYLSLQIIPIYALMQGYGLEVGMGAAAAVLVILRLGTILPQAPGNVGAFQFFTVVALRLFGVDKATATGFATMMFVVVTLPLWLGGLIAVAITGLRIRDLQQHAQSTLSATAASSATPRG
jgi:uncharacterized protein (TIRG00374 family)